MKLLESGRLEALSSLLSSLELGEWRVHGRVESYSCKVSQIVIFILSYESQIIGRISYEFINFNRLREASKRGFTRRWQRMVVARTLSRWVHLWRRTFCPGQWNLTRRLLRRTTWRCLSYLGKCCSTWSPLWIYRFSRIMTSVMPRVTNFRGLQVWHMCGLKLTQDWANRISTTEMSGNKPAKWKLYFVSKLNDRLNYILK